MVAVAAELRRETFGNGTVRRHLLRFRVQVNIGALRRDDAFGRRARFAQVATRNAPVASGPLKTDAIGVTRAVRCARRESLCVLRHRNVVAVRALHVSLKLVARWDGGRVGVLG